MSYIARHLLNKKIQWLVRPLTSSAINACKTNIGVHSNSTHNSEELDNTPAKFFGSNAATWSAKQSRSGGADNKNIVWYQPYVISASLAIFLVYFCILREESDIDLELERNLYDRVPGLEETQLKLSLNYQQEKGMNSSAIEARLAELSAEKQ